MQPKLAAFIVALLCAIATRGHCQNKIVVIGSSTASGTGLTNPYTESWVNRLKSNYLARQIINSESNVVNLAQPSTNCVTGMPTGYISQYNVADFLGSNASINITAAIQLIPKPNVIIINYPTNGYDWMPFQDILFHLKTIKHVADSAGIRCFVTTSQPRNQFSPTEREKLKRLRDSILVTFGYFAIDFWTPLALPDNTQNPLYAADNTHPNAAGHELLYRQVISKDLFGFIALPVSNIVLHVKKVDAKTELSWSADAENSVSFFNIEKSKNGRTFYSIGQLKSSGINTHNYNFTDPSIDTDETYYRIARISLTGKVEYSKIVSIRSSQKSIFIDKISSRLIKNDLTVSVTAQTSGKAKVFVTNGLGAVVFTSSCHLRKGTNTLNYTLPLRANGVYYFSVADERSLQTEKLIKND